MKRSSLLFALVLAAACDNNNTPTAKPEASASAKQATAVTASVAPPDPDPPPVGLPLDVAAVTKVVNPNHEKKYSGPTGTIRGVVRTDGDPPPDMPGSFNGRCTEAAATYGKLFRVGLDKALADVLVAVTPEHGYVPATDAAKKVSIHGCALSTKTVAVTFGQRIDVFNKDTTDQTYMPFLDGQKPGALMVAVPQGDAVKLYPTEPKAHYRIRDDLPHPFMVAEVFVLAYSTFAVTGLDGKFEVAGVPVGKAQINAFLPSIDKVVTKDVDVKEGDQVIDFTIPFDKKKDMGGAPSASASASAAPSVGTSKKKP